MEVLYEDNHLIAVNKAVGEIVQGDKTGDKPLSEIVKEYIKLKYDKPGEVFLGVTHRLDRPTTGVVLFARTSKALTRLNDLFREKSSVKEWTGDSTSIIHKTYWAIVEGCPALPQARLEHWLKRNEAQNKSYVVNHYNPALPSAKNSNYEAPKRAVLDYRVLARGEHYSLVEVDLLTGRHHQIRCQMAAIGCPVKGDLKYGARRSNPDGGICLHAYRITLPHPVKKDENGKPCTLTITAPVPTTDIWHKLNILNEQTKS